MPLRCSITVSFSEYVSSGREQSLPASITQKAQFHGQRLVTFQTIDNIFSPPHAFVRRSFSCTYSLTRDYERQLAHKGGYCVPNIYLNILLNLELWCIIANN
jgi:hypothetical protein